MSSKLEEIIICAYKDEMVSFLKTHPECLEEAVKLAVSDKQPFSWRSAWLLTNCFDEYGKKLYRFIPKLIEAAEIKRGGHQRELIKLLFEMELDEEKEGKLFDICMTAWEDLNRSPSERVIAIRYILKTAKKYPELLNEISFLLEDHYLETLSPGIKNSVRKMKNELKI